MAKLVLHFNGKTHPFDLTGTFTIGRLSSNDLQIPEERASRNHCRLIPAGGGFVLEDLNSANGTCVGDKPITRHRLKNGDRITIGSTLMVFEDAPEGDEGDLIAGKYKIDKRIGQGGMGAVYRATQLSMDRVVALKMLKPELGRSKQFVQTFVREARTAGQLNHPNIIMVHDFGQAQETYYMAMEFIQGHDVQHLLNTKRKLPVAKALQITRCVAEGLAHAHEHQIIHRDVKPQNIMLTAGDGVKLADLGLAKGAGAEDGRKSVIMGTPHYMAPEVAKREHIDGRADIYSLGATLYHMVTGRVPFDGPNSLAVITKHINQDLPSPKQYDVTLPDSVCELIKSMMAKDPNQRPQSAQDVVGRIDKITASEAASLAASEKRQSEAPQPRKGPRKRRAPRPPATRAAAPRPAAPRPPSDARIRRAAPAPEERRAEPADVHHGLPWAKVVLVSLLLIALVIAGMEYGPQLLQQYAGGSDNGGSGPSTAMQQQREAEEQVRELWREASTALAAREWQVALSRVRQAETLARNTSLSIQATDEVRSYVKQYEHAAEQAWNDIQRAEQREQSPETLVQLYQGFIARFPDTVPSSVARQRLERTAAQLDEQQDVAAVDPAEEQWERVRLQAGSLEAEGQLLRAKRVLDSFVRRHPDSPQADEARKRSESLEATLAIFLDQQLAEGRRRAEAGRYSQASQYLTSVLVAGSAYPQAAQAREILQQIGEKTRSVYEAAHERVVDCYRSFDFTGAEKAANEALGELTGTQWEAPLQEDLLAAAMGQQLVARLQAAIANAPRSDYLRITVPAPDGNGALNAFVKGATKDGLDMSLNRRQFNVAWADLDLAELARVLDKYLTQPEDRFFAGVFYLRRGLKSRATDALRAALSDETVAERAAPFLARTDPELKLVNYDWSAWNQLTDWRLQGDWGMDNGVLRQQTAEGDASAMHQSSYAVSDRVYVSMEVTPTAGSGLLAVELVQDEDNRVGFTLDADNGLEAFAALGGAAENQRIEDCRLQTGRPHQITLMIAPDRMTCRVNGRDLPPLAYNGGEAITGRLLIRLSNLAGSVDNVQIRKGL